MTRPSLAVAALMILTGCTTTSNLKATPLKDQSAAQIESDRKRCEEWSKKTAAPLAGFAACLVAAGYETTPEVGSTSQTLRLAKPSTATEPTRVLLDVLDCDSHARRKAERDLGMISRWIRENLVYWRSNTELREKVFVDCIKPRGYELGKG
ncbi:MAG: hypothetical protein DMD87_26065 [Candidatus Rokuibacteriota bacterium]|nr:MAG: hypothetical protein DMD87_26065 [Candidatus Rokubacteria bacterium]